MRFGKRNGAVGNNASVSTRSDVDMPTAQQLDLSVVGGSSVASVDGLKGAYSKAASGPEVLGIDGGSGRDANSIGGADGSSSKGGRIRNSKSDSSKGDSSSSSKQQQQAKKSPFSFGLPFLSKASNTKRAESDKHRQHQGDAIDPHPPPADDLHLHGSGVHSQIPPRLDPRQGSRREQPGTDQVPDVDDGLTSQDEFQDLSGSEYQSTERFPSLRSTGSGSSMEYAKNEAPRADVRSQPWWARRSDDGGLFGLNSSANSAQMRGIDGQQEPHQPIRPPRQPHIRKRSSTVGSFSGVVGSASPIGTSSPVSPSSPVTPHSESFQATSFGASRRRPSSTAPLSQIALGTLTASSSGEIVTVRRRTLSALQTMPMPPSMPAPNSPNETHRMRRRTIQPNTPIFTCGKPATTATTATFDPVFRQMQPDQLVIGVDITNAAKVQSSLEVQMHSGRRVSLSTSAGAGGAISRGSTHSHDGIEPGSLRNSITAGSISSSAAVSRSPSISHQSTMSRKSSLSSSHGSTSAAVGAITVLSRKNSFQEPRPLSRRGSAAPPMSRRESTVEATTPLSASGSRRSSNASSTEDFISSVGHSTTGTEHQAIELASGKLAPKELAEIICQSSDLHDALLRRLHTHTQAPPPPQTLIVVDEYSLSESTEGYATPLRTEDSLTMSTTDSLMDSSFGRRSGPVLISSIIAGGPPTAESLRQFRANAHSRIMARRRSRSASPNASANASVSASVNASANVSSEVLPDPYAGHS
ncbi:hypothetical protein BC831DRAFT_474994 [Entophlyctis helioformis]|nr:hypothetical protein BC831DRAFT_474994 [Entophlyctis helioformis]